MHVLSEPDFRRLPLRFELFLAGMQLNGEIPFPAFSPKEGENQEVKRRCVFPRFPAKWDNTCFLFRYFQLQFARFSSEFLFI
jgi:hypothetical protein